LQLGPCPWEAAGSPNSGGSGGAPSWGTAGISAHAHLGATGGRGWGGGAAGAGNRRRPVAVAAAARTPAGRWLGVDKARARDVK
jgi:hypothetical protein